MTHKRTQVLGASIVTSLTGVVPLLLLAACAAPPASRPASQSAQAVNAVQPAASARVSPTSIRVPKASSVKLSLDPDMNVHVKPPKPVTITDPAAIRRLTALIDGLPPFPLGRYACPFDGNARLVLAFSAAPGGPVRTVATLELEGCEGVELTIGGVQQPTRGVVGGGRQVAAQALKAAGLNWNLRPYLS